ncbi:hypothetical protein F4780DRAFT_780799 [Xylariomycetidae sp. FL0641]|nr:hypothetical protein F4780DRAFT_780799 [Xylariomycetidae sp. FL0641]
MKYIAFLLLNASFASTLQLDVGDQAGLPTCASHCMVDSMFITQCLDMNCLCHQKDYQMSLFQCLYSQCDAEAYGPALSRTITVCMDSGATIYMAAPGTDDASLLAEREADYLAGRSVAEIPGLQLRQDSVGPAVVTTTVTEMGNAGAGPAALTTLTATVWNTVTYSGAATVPVTMSDATSATAAAQQLTPTPFFDSSARAPVPLASTTSADRPWVITRSAAGRSRGGRASFSGLVLWFVFVLFQDYWLNGY